MATLSQVVHAIACGNPVVRVLRYWGVTRVVVVSDSCFDHELSISNHLCTEKVLEYVCVRLGRGVQSFYGILRFLEDESFLATMKMSHFWPPSR